MQRSTMAPPTPTQNAGESSNQEPQSAMNPWKKKAKDTALIHVGAGPSNAENDDHAGRGVRPDLSQLHIPQRAPAEGPSSTGCLKTLGVQNGDTARNPADTHLYNAGRNRTAKGPLISPSGRVHQPRCIDTNTDGYSYSRDTVGNSPDIYIYTVKPFPDSPDDRRRSIASLTLNRVPEEMESGVITPEHREQRQRSNTIHTGESSDAQPYYGSVGHGVAPSRGYLEEDLLDVESDSNDEEEEWLVDEELARQGLYRGMFRKNFSRQLIYLLFHPGNYKTLLLLYTFVPFTAILAFLFLGLLPTLAFPSSSPSPFPYPPYLPFPLPEICTAMALWSLSYLLRDFLYAASLSGTSLISFPTTRFPSFIPILTSLVSTFLQSASALFFRQLAVPILLIPFYSSERMGLLWPTVSEGHEHHFPTWQDDAFRRVWWVALGWAAAEAVVGIKQGYESISLYKDVLVSVKRVVSKDEEMTRSANVSDGEGQDLDDAVKDAPPRSMTPVTSRTNQGESSAPPAQKNSNSPQEVAASANPADNLPPSFVAFPSRREHLNSLSSFNSMLHLEDLSRSVTMGERQPLLPLNLTNLQSPRPTQESERLLAENAVERDLEELMAIKNREDLEEVYGIPVIVRVISVYNSQCQHLKLNCVYSILFRTYRSSFLACTG